MLYILLVSSVSYKTDDIVNKIDFNAPGDSILGGGVLENRALFFSKKNGVLNVTVSEDIMSGLDAAVASLSEELIDDYPAADPRWAESIPAGGISASSSLIILHQLEDKLKAHEFFVNFLKGVTLWDKLKSVKVRKQPFPTWCLMCEHSEKLCAAIALCRLHKTYQEIVDVAISLVMKKRGTTSSKGLTEPDLFFREVSHVEEIFDGFLEHEEEMIRTTTADHVQTIVGINNLMQEMLQDAWTFRQQNSSLYQVNQVESDQDNELMFWTGTSGPMGLRNIIFKQLQITVERGVLGTEDHKVQSTLYQQMVNLADILLDGYLVQLESIQSVANKKDRYDEVYQKYEQDRRAVILPLVDFHQFSQAASLAEKYQDFGILIELCESRDDKESLQKYSTQFSEQGFSDYLFKWYMDKGERHKLMNQPALQHENLGKFLSSHHHLSWLHDVHTKSFYKAHQTLKNLADNEKTFLERKKNAHISVETMPPLSPSELIDLYIGDNNAHSNEYDFKKALDLLRHANNFGNDDIDSLKRHIWCRALLKDNWLAMRDIDPLASARNTVFFKTVELAYSQGLNLKEFMPSMEALLQSEDLKNAGLLDNPNFRYLLSAGYEQIERSAEDQSEMVA
ncbi:hypothetical protein QZH41_013473 [Actinostola sp. cb2023]|nr:hypothetical protein QZH41_013473 [Actinostola sp. cb2023]